MHIQTRVFASCIASFAAAMSFCIGASATEVGPAVRFYSDALQEPIVAIGTLLKYQRLCYERDPVGCGDFLPDQPSAFEDVERLLAHVSLVPTLSPREVSRSTGTQVLYRVLEKQTKRVLDGVLSYDVDYFARYGATADVCPFEREDQLLTTMVQITLHRFWRLSGTDLDSAVVSIIAKRREYTHELRDLSSLDCTRFRDLGAALFETYKVRVRPYAEHTTGMDVPQRTKDAYGFIMMVLSNLEVEAGNQYFDQYLKSFKDQAH